MPATGQRQPDTDELLDRAGRGDSGARHLLMERHRARLRRMVAVRLDGRVAARVDPSDLVQETLAEAAARLGDYLRGRPLPFYPWLRTIAWDRLVEAHRRHLHAGRRSVAREVPWSLPLPDESAGRLADRLVASGTSPSRRLIRAELRDRLKTALDRLPPRDREVLVMRHLEQMEVAEIAAVLGLTAGAVMTRNTRALARLRALLDDERPEELP
jgi:RNA polymerase sigma-70 factor (ECF subfamily)